VKNTGDGKAMALRLRGAWEEVLKKEGLSQEVEYRIRKMNNRLTPIVDKLFLKTLKGQEIILQCVKKTKVVETELNSYGEHKDRLYYSLTDLEKTYEDFIKQSYEFHITAG